MSLQTKHHRSPSFLDSSLKLDGIIEIITMVSKESMYFSEMTRKSRIKLKKSFIKYLNYCATQEFIKKSIILSKEMPDRYRGNHLNNGTYSFYETTDKGREFLNMVQ